MFAPVAAEGELLQFLIPSKSVGRLVFADGDCASGAALAEVNVVCDVSFADAIDAATEQSLSSYESAIPTRGRALATVYEHEVDWGAAGPFPPIEAQCGEAISFAWSGPEEQSLFYLPDGDCPLDWYGENNTAVLLHELAPEGMYNLQLPLEGEFMMAFASSALDGMSCSLGHRLEVFVSCGGAGNYTIDDAELMWEDAEALAPGPAGAISNKLRPKPKPMIKPMPEAPAPAPAVIEEPKPLPAPAPAPASGKLTVDDDFMYFDDELSLAPAPAPETELLDDRALRLDKLLGPAPGPSSEEELVDEEEEEYTLEDMAPAEAPSEAEELDYELEPEDLEPAPAPEEPEPKFRDFPRPKSESEYDYDYEGVPAQAPSEVDEPQYVYYYEELDVPDGAAPGPAPVLKRIKRKSGEPVKIVQEPPLVPNATVFANGTENTAISAVGARPVALAVTLGAGALFALLA